MHIQNFSIQVLSRKPAVQLNLNIEMKCKSYIYPIDQRYKVIYLIFFCVALADVTNVLDIILILSSVDAASRKRFRLPVPLKKCSTHSQP